MALTPWKKISEEVKHVNFKWEYRVAKYIAPNGKEADYFYLHPSGGGAVLMVAVDADGKIPWVREYRPLFEREVEGFPIGAIDAGESRDVALQREFAEESQLKANKIEYISSFAPAVTDVDSEIHIYVGYDLEPAEAKIDDIEEFERMRLTPEEVEEAIKSGKAFSGVTIAAWYLVKPRILEIIDEQKRKM